MGYPTRLLSDDEVIEAQFRPHWSGILREGLIVLVGIALAVVLWIFEITDWLAYAALAAVVIVLIARGLIRWFTTLHVITNERLIYRAGLIAKRGTEIPLEVIQNVAFNQTVFERVFGTGDLMFESAGAHGQTRYSDIPRPEWVQSLIYRVREVRMREVEGEDLSPDASITDLERLSRLHDAGKLSDEEFQERKTRLLGGES